MEVEDTRQEARHGSLEEEATLNLWRTADRLQIHFTRLFRSHGLTPQQYNVLRILRGAREALACLGIASRLITGPPAITGLVGRLDEAGLIARERSSEDRRVVHVRITPLGRQKLRALDAPVERLHKELLGHLGNTQLRQLIDLAREARRVAEDQQGA